MTSSTSSLVLKVASFERFHICYDYVTARFPEVLSSAFEYFDSELLGYNYPYPGKYLLSFCMYRTLSIC